VFDEETIAQRRRELIDRAGAWTAHNIRLGGDVFTVGPEISRDEYRARQTTQIVADLVAATSGDLHGLRILDLACLEGLHSVELAMRGAEVVGIEGRELNLEKAQFAKDVLELDNLHLILDDVRNLGVEKYGHFDAVLCLGILYHLERDDALDLLEHVSEVCRRFAVIDTHVSVKPRKRFSRQGHEYAGFDYYEHEKTASVEQRAKRPWASLDNPTSFWLTEASLVNALFDVGFTSVHKCINPSIPEQPRDRVTLLAFRGSPIELASCHRPQPLPVPRQPEHATRALHEGQRSWVRRFPTRARARAGALARRLFVSRLRSRP